MDTSHGLTGYLKCATEKGNKATGFLQLHQSTFSDSEIFLAGKGRSQGTRSRLDVPRKVGPFGSKCPFGLLITTMSKARGFCDILKARALIYCRDLGFIHPSTVWHFCYFLPRDACFSL